MPVQKVEHYECPVCICRTFTISVRTPFKDVLPLIGEEDTEKAKTFFTCSHCGRTYLLERLRNTGTYNPAERLEDALKPKG